MKKFYVLKKIVLFLSFIFCFSACSVLEANHEQKVSYIIEDDNVLSREDIIFLSKTYTDKANFYKSFKYQESYYKFLGKTENLRRVYMEEFIFKDYEDLKMFCKDIENFSKNYIVSKNKTYKIYNQKNSFGVYTVKNNTKIPKMLFSFSKKERYDYFWDKPDGFSVAIIINIIE